MFSKAIYKTLNLTEEVEMNDANNIHKAQQIGVIKQTTRPSFTWSPSMAFWSPTRTV